MEYLIVAGVAFVAGLVATLLLAKWKPTWFLAAETVVAKDLKVTGSSNSTLSVSNTK